MGTRNTFASPLSTGRSGWSQGRGDEADSWSAVIGGHRLHVVRARGMFWGEMLRPGGRGVITTGDRRTLLDAQLAVERLAEAAGRPLER